MATTYVRAANPIWWLPDHTGLSLNDEYYAFFLTNTLPYIPQSVYQDPAGNTQFSNPIQFSAAGTLPDNLYFDPTLTYRIEIRHGNTQADELIWEINDFVPGSGSGGSTVIDDRLTVSPNLITNPQFADIDFQSPFTFTKSTPTTYTLDIGPGWQLILSGSGATTLTQTANAGSSGTPGNPPYYLDIESSGWTSVVLRQRLENNGAIFSGGAVAIALTVASVNNPEILTVSYAPSTGTATNIFQQSIPTGTLTAYKYAVDIPASTNSDSGTGAYVDILFTMPGTSRFQLTNIQLTGQSSNLSAGFDNPSDAPSFQELSYGEVVNGEFNVYRDGLLFKPVPSYLVGWDFPLNPAQFFGDSVVAQAVGVNKSYYAWDQTIVFQTADSGITVTRNINEYGIQLTPAANGQAAIIQYMEPYRINDLLLDQISVNVRGNVATGKTLKCTVSLWYTTDASLPDITAGNNNSLVATLDANGKPATFNGNWTEVTRTVSEEAVFTMSETITDYGFNIWNLNDLTAAKNATYFAIVIGTAAMTSASPENPQFISVGLCKGSIPTIPAPQTPDQVLRECQYYYEKSYDLQTEPGTVTNVGVNSAPAFVYVGDGTRGTLHDDYLFPRSFYIQFKQTKRTVGNLVLYSPIDGASGNVSAGIYQNNTNPAPTSGNNPRNYLSSNFSGASNVSKDGVFLLATANASISAPNNAILEVQAAASKPGDEGIILYHYTVDARLGII